MPVIPDETVSAAASKLSNKLFIAFIAVTALATMIYYLWPSRLLTVLLAAMNETRKIYREAQEMGLSVQTEMDSLRRKVSSVVEETRYNSGSWPTALCDFICGRTFSLLHCIYEVKRFGTHIKMLKDIAQLRTESNLPPWTIPQRRGHPFRDYAAAVVVAQWRAAPGCANNFGGLFVVLSPLVFLVDPASLLISGKFI
ncbi:hypothetical protein MSAN_00904400 [Mycena sanguinolenta]|uniref:Uncharacterized protein n=1 Tax=Mycena sanguinolenta TaxID=230812 RepID=A0A8H7D8T1_9AGAR|nr:hypothetical protein MSAN_00904400 [Mycena sanguinolenta]